MACACGSGGANIAYRLATSIDGEQTTTYVATLGEVRMARKGGAAVAAVAVPKTEMDEWQAKQDAAA